MAQNLELKVKVTSHESFKKILKAISAEYKGILDQKDTYYKYEKGLLKLRKVNGKFELIKYVRDESAETRWSNYELLYITSPNAEEYLNDIFTVEAIVQKKRELFLYDGTRIHLDDVSGLGLYLELETVVDDRGQDNAENRYFEIFDLLNLADYDSIKNSYRNLILKK